MCKEILLAALTSLGWSNLFEVIVSIVGNVIDFIIRTLDSLVGALVGGFIALYIAKSQTKKGEEQFNQQLQFNKNLFEKEMDIIKQNNREDIHKRNIDRYFNLQLKELEHKKESLSKMIDRTYSHIDMLHTLQTEYSIALNKNTPYIYSGNILRAYTKIAEYTINYKKVELKEEDFLKEEVLDEEITHTISKIISEDVKLTELINKGDISILEGDDKPNYLSIIDRMFTELENLLTHLYKKSNNIDEEIARKKNQMKSRIEQGVQESSEATIE